MMEDIALHKAITDMLTRVFINKELKSETVLKLYRLLEEDARRKRVSKEAI